MRKLLRQLRTNDPHGCENDDGNQCSDQAVLDSGGAGFIAKETVQAGHAHTPINAVSVLEGKTAD